jgi:ligand-binding sensor domain-containing protein
MQRLAFRFLCLIAIAAPAWAEQLPVQVYTTADGLAHNHINCIRQDSRGFLWFCTDEGLTRFDGYRLVTFESEAGGAVRRREFAGYSNARITALR